MDGLKNDAVQYLAPGVFDMQSYRTALEMGYEVHADGMWWPVWRKPGHYVSPDGKKTKFVQRNVSRKNWAWA
jgi:hypothetical protein